MISIIASIIIGLIGLIRIYILVLKMFLWFH
jgi:uncharacterized membrane protein